MTRKIQNAGGNTDSDKFLSYSAASLVAKLFDSKKEFDIHADELDSMQFSPEEIHELCAHLSAQKIATIKEKNPLAINELFKCLQKHLTLYDPIFNIDQAFSTYSNLGNDSEQPGKSKELYKKWLADNESPNGGKHILSALTTSFCSFCLLLRIQFISSYQMLYKKPDNGSDNQNSALRVPTTKVTSPDDFCDILSLSLSTEQIENVLTYIHRFLLENRLLLGRQFTSQNQNETNSSEQDTHDFEAKSKSSEKSKLKEKLDTTQPLTDIGVAVCSTMLVVIEELQFVVQSHNQAEHLIISIYELCFHLLRLDPTSNPKSELLNRFLHSQSQCSHVTTSTSPVTIDMRASTVLGKLQLVAKSTLVVAYKSQLAHRASIVQDFIPCVSQVFGVKIPYRSFAVTKSSTETAYITVTTATLLHVLQSAVLLAQSNCTVTVNALTGANSNLSQGDPKGVDVTRYREEKKARLHQREVRRCVTHGKIHTVAEKNLEYNQCALLSSIDLSMREIRELCSNFVCSLLKRCFHKDTQSEYRPIMSAFTEDLLITIHSADFPYARVLLEHFVYHLQSSIHELVKPSAQPNDGSTTTKCNNTEDTKQKVTYINFCMDLLTAVGCNIRGSITANEVDLELKSIAELPSTVLAVLKKKLKRCEQRWLSPFQGLESAPPRESSQRTTKSAYFSNHDNDDENRLIASTNTITASVPKHLEAKLISHCLAISNEVSAITRYTLATSTDTDVHACSSSSTAQDNLKRFSSEGHLMGSGGNDDSTSTNLKNDILMESAGIAEITTTSKKRVFLSSNASSSDCNGQSGIITGLTESLGTNCGVNQIANYGFLPPPVEILRQCGISNLIIRYMERIEIVDQVSFSVLDYLRFKSATSSEPNSKIVTSCITQPSTELSLIPLANQCSCSANLDSFDAFSAVWLTDIRANESLSRAVELSILDSVSVSLDSLKVKTLSHTISDSASSLSPAIWKHYYSQEMIKFPYRHILVARSFTKRFDAILRSLLCLFAVSTPSIRARLIKSLNQLIRVDEKLLSRDIVERSIIERFNDVAVSVREEAVRLVGQYIIKNTNVSLGYSDALIIRLKDKGISVRKSVVNIFRELLSQQPSHPRYSEICLSLLERSALPKEEDSIKDSIRNTFTQIWFLPPPAIHVVTPTYVPSRSLAKTDMPTSAAINSENKSNVANVSAKSSLNFPSDMLKLLPLSFSTELQAALGASESASTFVTPSVGNQTASTATDAIEQPTMYPRTRRSLARNHISNEIIANKIYSNADTAGVITPHDSCASLRLFRSACQHIQDVAESKSIGAVTSDTNNFIHQTEFIKKLKLLNLPTTTIGLSAYIMSTRKASTQTPSRTIHKFSEEAFHWARSIQDDVAVVDCSSSNRDGTTENITPVTTIISTACAVQSHINASVRQLLEVVSTSQTIHHVWISDIIRDALLGNKAAGDDSHRTIKARRESASNYCELLVSRVVETLFQAEERNVELLQVLAAKRTVSEEIVCAVVCLSLFAQAHPHLLIKHLPALAPYLKGENGLSPNQESIVTLRIIEIFSYTVVLENVKLGVSVREITSDLIKIALKSNSTSVSAAINCLSLVASYITKDVSPIYTLAEKMFNSTQYIIGKNKSFNDIPKPQIGRILRCLVVLGSIGESYKICMALYRLWADDQISQLEPFQFEQRLNCLNEETSKMSIDCIILNPRILLGAVYALALACLSNSDTQLQSRAIQTICSVFIGCPKLIIHSHNCGILNRLFRGEYPPAVVEKMLIALKYMMESEEKRLEKDAACNQMTEAGVCVDHRVRGPVDQDSDATIAGFILQHHLKTLLQLVVSPQLTLRKASLRLLITLLNQGMLCPLDIISHLVACQGDIDYEVRVDSLKALQTLDEKYPSFLENRIIDGVDLAFLTHIRLFSTHAPTEADIQAIVSTSLISSDLCKNATFGVDIAVWSPSIFKALYCTCFQQSPKRRADFIQLILRRSNQIISKLAVRSTVSNHAITGVSSKLTREDLHDSGEQILFNLSTISSLPFESADEVHVTVYWINRFIPLCATQILSQVEEYLQSIRAIAVLTSTTDSLSNASTTEASSTSSDLKCLQFTSTSFGHYLSTISPATAETILLNLQTLALSSTACKQFLMLKSYVKSVYNVSDDRCGSFNPDNKVFQTERVYLCDDAKSFVTYTASDQTQMSLHKQFTLPAFTSTTKYTYQSADVVKSLLYEAVIISIQSHRELKLKLESGDLNMDFTLAQKRKRNSNSRLKQTTSLQYDDSVAHVERSRCKAAKLSKSTSLHRIKPGKLESSSHGEIGAIAKRVQPQRNTSKRSFSELQTIDEDDEESDEDDENDDDEDYLV